MGKSSNSHVRMVVSVGMLPGTQYFDHVTAKGYCNNWKHGSCPVFQCYSVPLNRWRNKATCKQYYLKSLETTF